jgi:hypothetical protein
MGMGATNTIERVLASVGAGGVQEPSFQPTTDLENGGVLLALPALLAMGLLRHTRKYFSLPKGYYGIETIFTLLAFMALCRVKSVESLRYSAPGEWGKLLGLDRIPEVKTLREKLTTLASQGTEAEWNAKLCEEWMEASPQDAGVLYIDGHVRVYHGSQTKLPRHYVSREKLCQRATCDYWVNALDGQPFFKINKAVDPGLIEVIKTEIVPYLKETIPNQPSEAELIDDRYRHRFTLVFDREGYSPDLFKDLKDQHISCHSYHKFPGPDWPALEFTEHSAKLPQRVLPSIMLAERGTRLSNNLWVRECRRLTDKGHQTSILSTDYRSSLVPIAAEMLCRWSQENFFKYMREHFSLDMLIDHQTAPIDETTKVVNPAYRDLEGKVKSRATSLSRLLATFGALNLTGTLEEDKVEEFEQTKAKLHDEISLGQADLAELKSQRKKTKKHITLAELPEDKRFRQLSTHSKHLIDTIKMIAYRAETSLASIVREKMVRADDARALVRSVYAQTVDLVPMPDKKELHVRVHHAANHMSDDVVRAMCSELNETKTLYPGTEMRLVYSLVSDRL